MKKLFILGVIACFTMIFSTAKAVEVKIGVHAGGAITRLSTNYKCPVLDYPLDPPIVPLDIKTSVGVTAGVSVDLNFFKGLGLNTGVDFLNKIANNNWGMTIMADGNRARNFKSKFFYISVPVLVSYQLKLPTLERIFIPSISTGLITSFELTSRSLVVDSNKAVVLDWRIGVGFLFAKHYQLSASYNIPLTNTTEFDTRFQKGIENKIKYWTVTVGYVF